MFVPQGVPFVALVPPVHVETPVEHAVVLTRQTLPPGLHVVPAVHATHAPALHTWLVPQPVPFPTAVSGAAHFWVPDAHE
jgi:hypothetical protein